MSIKFKSLDFLIIVLFIVNLLLFFSFTILKSFPVIPIYVHVCSLIFLWVLFVLRLNLYDLLKTKWKEAALILLLIIVAFIVRIDRVEEISPGMYPDEIDVAQWGVKLQQRVDLPPFIAEGYYHPTPLLHITAYSVQMLGNSMTSIRLPNIIIGSLTVGAIYILFRIFFPVSIALFGAVLLMFQYTHIIISRFSYEAIPALFFQILALLFFTLYWKKRDFIYLNGIALSLGAGMYTYLNFRPFALIMCLLTIILLLRHNYKRSLNKIWLFSAIFFIGVMPLLSYSVIDPQGFSGRISDISIFSHNYSPSEFANELGGNIFRITVLPFYQLPTLDPNSPPTSGDPNPRHNPALAPMFDLLTVLLGMVGLIYLFLKNRKLFWIVVIFSIPPILSDVFANERIPDFHYYGIGHPHAMRVSGFILTTLFAATAGLYWIYARWNKGKLAEVLTVISIFVGVVCYWNWHLYFDQSQISPGAYVYNYTNNFAQASNTAKYLNMLPGQEVSITTDIADTKNFQFLIDSNKKQNRFELIGTESAMFAIQKSEIIAIGVTEKTIPILNSLDSDYLESIGYTINTLNNPLGQPEVIIISKQ